MGLKITSSTGTSDGNSSSVYGRIKHYFVALAAYVQIGTEFWKNQTAKNNGDPVISSTALKDMYEFPIVENAWAGSTDYNAGDLVVDAGTVQKCNTDHTSQAALSDDAASWDDVTVDHFTQADLESDDIFAKCYAKLKAKLQDEGKTIVDVN